MSEESKVKIGALIEHDPLIEEVLDAWAVPLGQARAAYRGHVYRVYNLGRQILGSERHDAALALASAFHDIGIWSDETFDYVEPSVRRAATFLRTREAAPQLAAIAEVIRAHHALCPVRTGSDPALVEAFRRADLVDLSGGWFRAGVSRGFLQELRAAFPYAGFHRRLAGTALAWCVRHPLRPFPMLRLHAPEPAPLAEHVDRRAP